MYIFNIKLLKSRFKDETCMYTLCFQIITYPIFELKHLFIALCISLFYILKNSNIKKYKIIRYISITYTLFIYFNIILCSMNTYIYSTNKNSYLYGKLTGNITNYKEIENYINNNIYILENDYQRVFIFNSTAYLIKLDMNIKINKYDLINNGNMGYKGDEKIIKEIDNKCSKEKCMFITEKEITDTQVNKKIINYIKNNYNQIDTIENYNIYISK